MAETSRFASLEPEDLTKILNDRDSKNTKNVIGVAKRIIGDYLLENLDQACTEDVVKTLRQFYGEVRKTDGTLYAKKSLITLRFGLQKHFIETRKEDIINSEHYNAANDMFKAMMVAMKKEGKATVNHKEPICPEDLQKLYKHEHFSLNTPEALQKRVFFEYLYYFCNRGRENIRDVQRDDFELKRDAKGLRYVRVKVLRQTKNHRGDDFTDVDDKDGRMYEIPGSANCPVRSFTKYFSKLHPDRTDFWQRPKLASKTTESADVWYDNSPVGKNTLGNLMAKISEECGLSRRYTNHCIRTTCITVLDEGGIETRHIMGLSGHKSESAVKSYCKRLSSTKKHEMSNILSETIQSATSSNGELSEKRVKTQDTTTSICDNGFDLLSNDVEFDQILQDISSYESNQTNIQNIVPTSCSSTVGVNNNFRFPLSGFSIQNINNSNIHFHFEK